MFYLNLGIGICRLRSKERSRKDSHCFRDALSSGHLSLLQIETPRKRLLRKYRRMVRFLIDNQIMYIICTCGIMTISMVAIDDDILAIFVRAPEIW